MESDGYGRMVERGDPHGVGDPHRAAGCRWNGTAGADQGWFSLLDWSVYHAPGWEEWQVFRRGRIGQPMPERCASILAWWADHDHDLPTAVRVVNILRSLRGQFTEYPELRDALDSLNPELHARWKPRG